MEQRQAEPAPDAVVIDRLACLRGGRLVFEGVDWRIARGTLGLLTGPNGAGKSTLLRIIAGLLRPAAGSIMVDGRVALADERRALDPLLTLRQALRFWAAMDAQSSTATDMVLESLGLAALADHLPHGLHTLNLNFRYCRNVSTEIISKDVCIDKYVHVCLSSDR